MDLCIAYADVNSWRHIYVAKSNWKSFNKSDSYPISKNAWIDRIVGEKVLLIIV